jgi:hypothetical protein
METRLMQHAVSQAMPFEGAWAETGDRGQGLVFTSHGRHGLVAFQETQPIMARLRAVIVWGHGP